MAYDEHCLRTPASDIVIALCMDLLSIAEQAMPDTFFETDSRTKRAREILDGYGRTYSVEHYKAATE
jgi:hypothetical protein